MEEQTFNKDGRVDKYTNLDDILKLNISDDIKQNFKDKYKKKVYYGRKGSCYVGTLVGIEVNEKLSNIYYMIFSGDKIRYLPCSSSITLL